MEEQKFNEATEILDSIKGCLTTKNIAKPVTYALLLAYKKQLEEIHNVCDDILKEYKESTKIV